MDVFTQTNGNFAKIYQLVKDSNDRSGKPLILGVLVVAILSLASLFSFECVLEPNWSSGVLAIMFWMLGYAILINFLVAASYKVNLIVIVALTLVLFLPIFFLKYFSILLLLLLLGTILLFWCSTVAMKKQMQLLIKLNWFQIAKKGIIFYTLIFLLTIGIFIQIRYFPKGEFLNTNLNETQITLGFYFERLIKALLEQLAKIKILPGINLAGTVDELINDNIIRQIKSLPVPLSATKQAALEQELRTQSRQSLEKLTGQKLEGKEKVSDVIANIILSKWKSFPPSTTTIISVLAFIFLIIPVVTIVNLAFSVLLIPLGWLIFRILLGLKLLKIKKIPLEKEILALN